MARRLLGSAGDTALRNLTRMEGAPVTTEQPPAPTTSWEPSDLMRSLANGEYPYEGGPFDADHIKVFRGDAARMVAEFDRLRGIEQRAREKANAPRRLDGAAPWMVASRILGEEAGS